MCDYLRASNERPYWFVQKIAMSRSGMIYLFSPYYLHEPRTAARRATDCTDNFNVTLEHHMFFLYHTIFTNWERRLAVLQDCTKNCDVTLGYDMSFFTPYYLHEPGTAARRKTKPPSAVHALSRAVRFYKGFLEVILFNLLVFRIFKNFFKTLKITCS